MALYQKEKKATAFFSPRVVSERTESARMSSELSNDELARLTEIERETATRLVDQESLTYATAPDGRSIWSTTATLSLMVFVAATLIFLALFFFITPSLGRTVSKDGCSVCPEGRQGPQGERGPQGVGRQGEKGDPGDPGPTGPPGPAGQGNDGVCIIDPMGVCPPAPPGPPGPPGNSVTGAPGTPGTPGTPAPPAVPGTPGANCYDDLFCMGNCTVADCKGAKGDTGDEGPTGAPGACDCAFNVTTGQLNVTGNASIAGTLMCDQPISSTCIGENACRDFSACNSTFNRINVLDQFFVGSPDGMPGLGPMTEVAAFGRYVGIGDPLLAWLIRAFYVYAKDTIIAGQNLLEFYSANIMRATADGAMLFSSGGTIVLMSGPAAAIDLTAGADVLLNSGAGLTDEIILTGTGSVTSFSQSVNHYAQTKVRMGSGPLNVIAEVDNQMTASCASGALSAGQSVVVYDNLRLTGQLVKQTTNSTSAYLQVGPFIEVCGGIIRSLGNQLTIQTNPLNQTLNVGGVITTLYAGQPVAINDPDGLDLRNQTCLLDSVDQVVEICPGNDLKVNGMLMADSFMVTNLTTTDLVVDTVTATGAVTTPTLNVGGMTLSGTTITGVTTVTSATVTFSGDVNCGGGSCTSDIRLKKEVEDLSDAESLDVVCSLRTASWVYEDWFCDAKGIQRGKQFSGFIAQDLQRKHPQAVRVLDQPALTDADGNSVSDILSVKKEETAHLLVGAVRELRRMLVEEGSQAVREMAAQLDVHATHVRSEMTALRDRTDRLEQRLAALEQGTKARLQMQDADVINRAEEVASLLVDRYDQEVKALRQSVELLQGGELAQQRMREQEEYVERHRKMVHRQRSVDSDHAPNMPQLFTAEELARRRRQRRQQMEKLQRQQQQ